MAVGAAVAALPHPVPRARSEALPPHARNVIALLAGLVVIAAAASAWRSTDTSWPPLVLFAVLGIVSERFDIDLYGDSRLSISALFLLTAAIVIGPTGVMIVGPAIAFAGHARRGRPLYKLLFNTSTFVVTGLASAYLYAAVLAVSPYEDASVQMVGALLAAVADFVVSSALVSLIIALTAGGTLAGVWREKFLWLAPHFLVLGFLAFVLSLAYEGFGVYGVLGFAIPALMMRFTMKQYVDRTERTVNELRAKHAEVHALTIELGDAYNETLAAFVAALDLRDTETHGHSQRVTDISLAIGEAMGIRRDSREWGDLKNGAMLHDVGKVGVPDSILRKPASLTDEEWVAIRLHPMDGYNMLRGVHFLAGAAELVLCHHERYDGRGYPRGLAGEAIPLGARIFAVADSFDAITSERSYKPAHSEDAALREIVANRGTQFDPRVVDILLHLKGRGSLARAA